MWCYNNQRKKSFITDKNNPIDIKMKKIYDIVLHTHMRQVAIKLHFYSKCVSQEKISSCTKNNYWEKFRPKNATKIRPHDTESKATFGTLILGVFVEGQEHRNVKSVSSPYEMLQKYTEREYSCTLPLTSAIDEGRRLTTRLGPLYPRQRHGTHCTRYWEGPRVGLEGCEKSRRSRDSIFGSSSSQRVAMPNELSWSTPKYYRPIKLAPIHLSDFQETLYLLKCMALTLKETQYVDLSMLDD